MRGHGPKDSPGVNYSALRGKGDFLHAENHGRQSSRSKFGLCGRKTLIARTKAEEEKKKKELSA